MVLPAMMMEASQQQPHNSNNEAGQEERGHRIISASFVLFAGLGVILGLASLAMHDMTSESVLLQAGTSTTSTTVPWRMSSNRLDSCPFLYAKLCTWNYVCEIMYAQHATTPSLPFFHGEYLQTGWMHVRPFMSQHMATRTPSLPWFHDAYVFEQVGCMSIYVTELWYVWQMVEGKRRAIYIHTHTHTHTHTHNTHMHIFMADGGGKEGGLVTAMMADTMRWASYHISGTRMNVYMHVCMHVCMYVCMYVCM